MSALHSPAKSTIATLLRLGRIFEYRPSPGWNLYLPLVTPSLYMTPALTGHRQATKRRAGGRLPTEIRVSETPTCR